MIDARMIIISLDIFVYDLERAVNNFSDWMTLKTDAFVKTRVGQLFLSLSLLGPIIFIPIQIGAWTVDYISAYQMFSWAAMILINLSSLVSVCRKGDWRVRLSMIGWVLTMISITLAACFK